MQSKVKQFLNSIILLKKILEFHNFQFFHSSVSLKIKTVPTCIYMFSHIPCCIHQALCVTVIQSLTIAWRKLSQ